VIGYRKLTNAPGKQNFGQLFHDAAFYRAHSGQNLHEYCFTKMTKLNKLQLSLTDEQIIDVIVDGVQDKQVQLTNCHTFVDFAAYIKKFPRTSRYSGAHSERRKRTFDDRYKNNNNKANRTNFKDSDLLHVKCFACNEVGHKRNACPTQQNIIKCSYCSKIGHQENVCGKKQFDEKRDKPKRVSFVGPIKESIVRYAFFGKRQRRSRNPHHGRATSGVGVLNGLHTIRSVVLQIVRHVFQIVVSTVVRLFCLHTCG
jgi:hypothetical protein